MNPEERTELFTPDPPGDMAALDADTGQRPQHPPDRSASRPELLSTLERLERTLDQMRGGLDATAREQRHREFSLARLVGAIAQVLVVGLVLWALCDWVFNELGQVLVKIGFAGVLQLGALTAFLLGRESDRG
jgi:hypothetical protein